MSRKLKPIPYFRSDAEERKFWETHNSTKYIDWSKAKCVQLPNLKLSTTAISLRLPQGLLDRIKIAANKRDVPYQSLIKVWLVERLDAEDAWPKANIRSPTRKPGSTTGYLLRRQ